MTKVQVVKTCMVHGNAPPCMEICGLENNEYLELPEVCFHSIVPATAENISSQADVKQKLDC